MLEIDIRLDLPDFSLGVSGNIPLAGITALFGPSGAGKSTLLRVIAGHERRAVGMIRYKGDVWQDRRVFVPPHRRGVGYLFQDARLFAHLDVSSNLAYAARRAPRMNVSLSYDEAVAALDLAPLLARRVGTLSGGEAQRVALGRALLGGPRLLLADEPLAALDIARKSEIIGHLETMTKRFGLPMIHVTHALDEAVRLADRMIVLSGGRIRASGPIAGMLARHDLAPEFGHFEAGAALDGTIIGHDRAFHLTRVSVGKQLLDMPGVDLPEGSHVRLRVRARDVAIAISRPSGLSIRNVLAGHILDVREEKSTAFAEVEIDIGGHIIRARITRAAVAGLGLMVGKEVFALVKSVSFDRRLLPSFPTLPSAGLAS